MYCPFCANEETQVKDSRSCDDGEAIRRRRYCSNCDSRFTTYERVQLREITVIKKDGTKTPFVKDKLMQSVEMAFRKRPLTNTDVETLVNDIMRVLEADGDTEITSAAIGDMVMDKLKKIDKVAFVRFASVYKNFESPDDFKKFIKKIAD